ncbi:MAG TPA: glycosyl hydrolase, partial [Novosphingobium sp.]|nr:glycosyl hydrolase [Novosphingobium sp.]
MTATTRTCALRAALAAASALTGAFAALPAAAQTAAPATTPADTSLDAQFRDPPAEARPRVWWHWMNGNITQDGIAKDLAWMKAVGIGGAQTFDANLHTPQIVPHRLVYMTPEWKAAFHFAASEADRLGLELAIAASPGWSETGGPWVSPEDGLKKLVWSEARLAPGQRLAGPLAKPPVVTGPFQSLPKQLGLDDLVADGKPPVLPGAAGDIAVLAIPEAAPADVVPAYATGAGTALDAARLTDADLATGVAVPRGGADAPAAVAITYAAPRAIRSATIFIAHASVMFGGTVVDPVLEASEDGTHWREIAHFPMAEVPTTISFAPVVAARFRVVLHPLQPAQANMGAPAPGIVAPDLFGALLGGAGQPWDVRQLTLSDAPAVDRFETKAGFSIAMDYYALGQPGDGAAGPAPARVIDITSHLKADGTLDWQAPALPRGQQWRIVRLGWSLLGTTNHPASPEATGLEVDKFDGEAVQRYMQHYLGLYRDAAGPGLIGAHGVRALVTDSIEVGAANWTPRMVAQFKARRGYDPTPWLPVLAGILVGSRAEADSFLYDYRRTLAELMASEHYGTVANMAHAAGLKVYGEALEDKRPSLGDDMAMRSHTDVPMSAMWTYPRGGQPQPSYLADIKGAASVAHIYGQNLVAAESMTSALNYWADSPRTLKHVIDMEFVTGVNRPVVHTSVHQPVDDKVPGLSLLIFGQFFNRHESWAPLARAWVDYISRNSLLLQKGVNVADVGYFYGEEAPLTGLYGLKPVADAPTTHAYDFVNADALAGALKNEGAELVTPGGARYKALYLGGSSRRMTLPALRRIADLAAGGATIIGLAPEGTPSLSDSDAAAYKALVAQLWPAGGESEALVGKGRVIASADVEQGLARAGIASDVKLEGASAGADIGFIHRRWAGGEDYFLVNKSEKPEVVEAHFRITGKAPELFHAETGTSEAVSYRILGGETVVPLSLAAEEAVHVVFRKPALADGLALKKLAPAPIATLAGPWDVAFQPGRGAPARATLAELKPLNEN